MGIREFEESQKLKYLDGFSGMSRKTAGGIIFQKKGVHSKNNPFTEKKPLDKTDILNKINSQLKNTR